MNLLQEYALDQQVNVCALEWLVKKKPTNQTKKRPNRNGGGSRHILAGKTCTE